MSNHFFCVFYMKLKKLKLKKKGFNLMWSTRNEKRTKEDLYALCVIYSI